jgi:3-hydroxyacyl-CoA dehydrogenase/enoyl-CoA hydratase/carnithine racemase
VPLVVLYADEVGAPRIGEANVLYESSSIRIELDDQIANLWLDCQGRTDNCFTLQTLDELQNALRAVQKVPCLDILVVRSAKPAGFSPGYDLEELARFASSAERYALAARGQQVAQLLSNLSANTLTVAVIDGQCRSAGLELALACDYRLAVAGPNTVFGFPEVNRGLAPCWGGTLRLPQLVGLNTALELLLLGRELSGAEAAACGLVDLTSSERRSRIELQVFLDKLQDHPRKPALPRRIGQRLLGGVPFGRWPAWRKAAGWLADVDADERPAARAILKAVRLGFSSSADALAAERSAFAELGQTPACRNAIEAHHRTLQPIRIHPEPINPVPPLPERVGIVGGGDLGGALACWFALRGRQIVLQESCEESLQLANERIDKIFQQAIDKGRLTSAEIESAKKNIRRTVAWTGLENAQFVVEAADEDLGVKRAIFHELELRVRPRTILATASSTIRVEAIQAELQRPGRVAGIHLFDAANNSPLVELVRAPGTDSSTLATLDSWLRSWGKRPILVSDRPGRLVARIQLAYLSEAALLVAEGLPPELIDRHMRRFGMNRGPLQTIDGIGFDSLARFVENLQIARGDSFARNLLLDRMRSFGWDGRGSGEGFYRYRRGRARPNPLARMVMWHDTDEDVISHYVFDPQQSLEDGAERLILRTINEAAACLPDEPDADPGLIDVAAAWGAGWAPHRGGPLQYADQLGLGAVVEHLTEFVERFGKRFEPCVELQRRAEAGESFYAVPAPEEIVEVPAVRRLAG